MKVTQNLELERKGVRCRNNAFLGSACSDTLASQHQQLLRAPCGRVFPFLVQNVALLTEEQQHEWGVNVCSDSVFPPVFGTVSESVCISWVWDAWASHACACTLMIFPKQDTLRVRTKMTSHPDSSDYP